RRRARGMSRLEVVVRSLLAGAPRRFRDRYEEDYLATVRWRVEDAAARGRLFALRLAVREILGVLGLVLRLRLWPARSANDPTRKGGGATMFETVRQDILFALETLRRNPR